MKWENACILNLEPEDRIINISAKRWKDRYQVPDNRCFNLGDVQSGFVDATTGCLRPSTCSLGTKLMIFAHGDASMLKVWGPFELGDLLCNFLGLREVGLIAFKACEVGKGDYLDRLMAYMSMRSMRIGWLIGYKHDTISFEGPGGVVREVVQDDEFEDLHWFGSGYKIADDKRVRVVKGNTNVVPLRPSNRY